jgi:AcrR family transcriptional regulator
MSMRPPVTAERLRDAAFELFSTQGFDATTVEDIAQRADVGRTTFFRHFRTKEDVVFPDHAGLAADVAARLQGSTGKEPVDAVTQAALVVLDTYVEEGERARARYRLVSSVEPLRARELASAQPYQRAFGHYLRRVGAEDPRGSLRAEVVSAAVIAAHNHVLRRWLREESDDPHGELREVLAELFDRWSGPRPSTTQRERAPGTAVVVVRSDLAPSDVASLVQDALRQRGPR